MGNEDASPLDPGSQIASLQVSEQCRGLRDAASKAGIAGQFWAQRSGHQQFGVVGKSHLGIKHLSIGHLDIGPQA